MSIFIFLLIAINGIQYGFCTGMLEKIKKIDSTHIIKKMKQYKYARDGKSRYERCLAKIHRSASAVTACCWFCFAGLLIPSLYIFGLLVVAEVVCMCVFLKTMRLCMSILRLSMSTTQHSACCA